MKFLLINISLFFSVLLSAQTHDINYYFEQAKINSPLINKSKNDNQLIKLDIQQLKSILSKPQINIEANLLFSPIISHDNGNKFQWVSDGANDYTGYDLSYSDGGQYQAFVSVKQPLFTSSRYKIYNQKADISSKLNDNNIKLTEHELEQLISRQYILCLRAKKQINIASSLTNKINTQITIIQQLVDNAIYKQTDLMQLQIEASNYKIQYQNYKTQYRNNLMDLNLICGITDTNLIDIQDVNFNLEPDTITQSQFLAKFKLDSLSIENEKFIFNQKYKPQVNLFANAGINAVYLPSFNRFGFATGINLVWNIFDGNQKKIMHDKTLIKLQTIEFEKQNFISKNKIYKQKYLTQIKSVKQQMKMINKQLNDYKKLLDLYIYEFSQGQVSIMDYKNLIRDISAKKQEYLNLEIQKQILINDYNYWNY